MPAGVEEEQEQIARQREAGGRLNGKEIVKTIVVPGELVNFVAR